jgi:hypothetical protein
MTKKRGKTDYEVQAELFIRTWQTAESAQEVADKLKMPKPIAHARASMYRGAGIKLKRMPRHRTQALDVKALNEIIAESDPPSGGEGRVPLLGPEEAKDIVGGIIGELHAGEPSGSTEIEALAFSATLFDCPRCACRTRLRDVLVERDSVSHVGPDQPLQCEGCGHQLTATEALPVGDGGVVRAGRWFTCLGCRRDSFTQETVEGEGAGSRTVRPPQTASCMHCGVEQSLTLAGE